MKESNEANFDEISDILDRVSESIDQFKTDLDLCEVSVKVEK